MAEIAVLVGTMPPDFLKDILPAGAKIEAGDTKIMWDHRRQDEVDVAKATFEKLLTKGYSAFRAEGADGHQGTQIHTFDPTAERMIMVPRIVGGLR